MARLRTWGWETSIGHDATHLPGGDVDPGIDGGALTRVSSPVRSGGWAAKADTGAGAVQAGFSVWFATAETGVGMTYYARIYARIETLPAADALLMSWLVTNTTLAYARVTTAGKVQLMNGVAGTQIGSDSAETIVAGDGTWHRFELSILTNTGSVDTTELRLNGTSVASATGLALSDSAVNRLSVAVTNAWGANHVAYFDDGAVNDSAGASQSSWPGDGKVVFLGPVSDTATRVGWVTNAGTTTTLYDALNNTPPVGIAVNTTPDFAYVKHPGGGAGNEYFGVNLVDYLTAGVPSDATVTVVQGVVNTGEEAATGSKTINVVYFSNTGTDGSSYALAAFDVAPTSGAQGTWPTNWWTKWSAVTAYNPSLTLGTGPVLRLNRNSTDTRVASVDLVGLYVEYVPAAATILPPFAWRRFQHRL